MAENTMNATSGSVQEQIEMLEEYLFENYDVRYNELSDKFEIREREEARRFVLSAKGQEYFIVPRKAV